LFVGRPQNVESLQLYKELIVQQLKPEHVEDECDVMDVVHSISSSPSRKTLGADSEAKLPHVKNEEDALRAIGKSPALIATEVQVTPKKSEGRKIQAESQTDCHPPGLANLA
jgi:hypothetical protein